MPLPKPDPNPVLERLRRLREAGPFVEPEPDEIEALERHEAWARAGRPAGEYVTTDELLAYLARCDSGLEPDDPDGD